MNEAPGCRVVTRRRIDGGTFLFDVNASGMNSERAIFGEVLPVLVHHPLHRGLLRRQYVGRSVVVRSVAICFQHRRRRARRGEWTDTTQVSEARTIF